MADHAPRPLAQSETCAALRAGETENTDALEAGRVLFAGESRFVAAAGERARIPPATAPEIAFAGRSNVGKSSLLNALTGRHALARVSTTPGRTRELIFFDLAGRLTLVDMPGYGYAKAPHRLAREWQGLMLAYLRGRANLRRVLLLLDARHAPKQADAAVMAILDSAAVTFQLVLTKSDALTEGDLAMRKDALVRLARAHKAAYPEVLATSSRSGGGIAELRAALALLAA
ncbi:MAG TPA: ribosome biogenesis GTP-binding protein YihA/YsxC [Acetobacteraceae bacterium]|nr:ribosome biogenesis GTP-binding protein YihA/YsxC [Acetobacteraceae bacterium]